MNKTKYLLALICLSSLLLGGCKNKSVEPASIFEIVGIEDDRDGQLHRSEAPHRSIEVISSQGGKITIKLKTTLGAATAAVVQGGDWIALSAPQTDQPRNKFTYLSFTVAELSSTEGRAGKIKIASTQGERTIEVAIRQSGRKPRPKLPIEYMAHYNVNRQGTGFVNSHEWSAGGYFGYDEAAALQIAGYHLPTPEEMNGVVPAPRKENTLSWEKPKIFVGVLEPKLAPPSSSETQTSK